jgi:hypothetical protein
MTLKGARNFLAVGRVGNCLFSLHNSFSAPPSLIS